MPADTHLLVCDAGWMFLDWDFPSSNKQWRLRRQGPLMDQDSYNKRRELAQRDTVSAAVTWHFGTQSVSLATRGTQARESSDGEDQRKYSHCSES